VVDVIEAIGNIGIQHVFWLFANAIENGCNGIMG
jgi:hypothetical protein